MHRHPHAPLAGLALVVVTAFLIMLGFAMGRATRPVVVAPVDCTAPR